MLAAVFKGEGKLVLEDRPKPVLKNDNDALIKVTGVGICGTDLHILQVPPAHPATKGVILGHEFTGRIVEVGRGIPDFKPGESVLIDPHPGCGQCAACKRGEPDRCAALYTTAEPEHPSTIGIFSDGAMTGYVIVPREALYKIDPGVPSHIAALAEPLSCVINAFDKLQMQPGESVVVLGAGPIGLLFTSLFRAAGASKLIVFFRVVLPLTVPGIVEATSLTYSLALSAFLFPMMLGGGKVKMMSNIIYENIYVTFDLPFAGALATILLVVSIATVTGMTLLQRTARRASHE